MDVCADVLEAWQLLFFKQLEKKRYHDNFICATTWTFQPSCSLHLNHFQFSKEELK